MPRNLEEDYYNSTDVVVNIVNKIVGQKPENNQVAKDMFEFYKKLKEVGLRR